MGRKPGEGEASPIQRTQVVVVGWSLFKRKPPEMSPGLLAHFHPTAPHCSLKISLLKQTLSFKKLIQSSCTIFLIQHRSPRLHTRTGSPTRTWAVSFPAPVPRLPGGQVPGGAGEVTQSELEKCSYIGRLVPMTVRLADGQRETLGQWAALDLLFCFLTPGCRKLESAQMGKLMDPRYPLYAPSSPALILEVLEEAMMETRACRKRPRPNLSARSGPRSAAFQDRAHFFGTFISRALIFLW